MASLSLRQRPLGFNHFPQEISSGFDSIFGLSGSLWPLIINLADLLACQNNGEDISMQARRLEEQLRSWSAPLTIDQTYSGQEAMLQIARAFKYTSLLTLYKMCLGEDYTDAESLKCVYNSAVDSLLRTCALSGPMSTILWPLYTIGLYAESRDQAVIRGIFSKFSERQHMMVVETAHETVRNSWSVPPSAPLGRAHLVLFLG